VTTTTAMKVLHVGSGPQRAGQLHPLFSGPQWTEVRLDANPAARPDLIASVTDMAIVAESSMDAVYVPHVLEHLPPQGVPRALNEIRRVLKPEGLALIAVPDLQAACQWVARDEPERVLHTSPLGPVTAMDLIFGHSKGLKTGNAALLHKTGFTASSLKDALTNAGFGLVEVLRDEATTTLWAKARPGAHAASSATGEQSGPFGL